MEELIGTGTRYGSPRQRSIGTRTLQCLSLVALTVSLVAAASASAAPLFPYNQSFTDSYAPQALAVDSAGNVYTVNLESFHSGSVKRFTSAGAPAPFSSPEPYVSANALTGTPNGNFGFGAPQIAIDNSASVTHGYIYVTNENTRNLDVFDASGNFKGELTIPVASGEIYNPIAGVAVDPSGNVYITRNSESGSARIRKFTPVNGNPSDDRFESALRIQGYFGALAVNAAGDAYVVSSGELERYAASQFGQATPISTPIDAGSVAVAIDQTTGDVFSDEGSRILHFDSIGNPAGPPIGIGQLAESLGVGTFPSAGLVFASNPSESVAIFGPPVTVPTVTTSAPTNVAHTTATANGHIDLAGGGNATSCHFQYGEDTSYGLGEFPCAQPLPISSSTDASAPLTGLTPDTTYHYRLVAGNANGVNFGGDQSVTPHKVILNTGGATELKLSTATLNGTVNPDGLETTYFFEYGNDLSYGHTSAPPPGVSVGTTVPGDAPLSADITGLEPGVTYHFRIVATNSTGTSVGADHMFTTPQPPSIDAYFSAGLSDTGANLVARINPHGFDTTFRFEYGTTPEYGSSIPVPDEDIGSGEIDQEVEKHIEELATGAVYHFRVVADNKWGTTTTGDQTFNFFPSACPNSHLRQQTSSSYLPDCRAYELVSPESAGGTILFPGGPNTGLASSPSRFSFVGVFGTIPGAGNPLNSLGDLYVATRTVHGWTSSYIGQPSNESSCMGGPPQSGPPIQVYDSEPDKMQNGVVASADMSRVLDWFDGNPILCGTNGNILDDGNRSALPSNAPYLWAADGSRLERWPTNLAEVPNADAALVCPWPDHHIGNGTLAYCPANVLAARELGHYFIATKEAEFAPGGKLTAPGSVYDNDVGSKTVAIVSKTPAGGDIGQEPGNTDPEALIRLPATSPDGSHILMATQAIPHCKPGSGGAPEYCPPLKASPAHLYMRVDDSVSYDVSRGKEVTYVGTTPSLSFVYFTSQEELLPADHDTSVDLYRWDESTDSLELVSVGEGTGNSDSCSVGWTDKCGVIPFSSEGFAHLQGGLGGNGLSDTAIAADQGDIYFYSPEQLDGTRGVSGQENVYDFREGKPRYVTTLAAVPTCELDQGSQICSDGPLARFQVNPADTHAAFLTSSRVTSYNNAGHAEMYTYEPGTGRIVCASCQPNGEPPKSDVFASQDGLFMANDGRVFFSTEDALVHRDTDEGVDVYEYVEGKPQLISPGTGAAHDNGLLTGIEAPPGLNSVSADGTDVYFATFDTLVPQDKNGNQLKFYDARSGGGIPFNPPPAPCAAADECHGPGSGDPAVLANGTGTDLGSRGNASRTRRKKRAHHNKHHRSRRHPSGKRKAHR